MRRYAAAWIGAGVLALVGCGAEPVEDDGGTGTDTETGSASGAPTSSASTVSASGPSSASASADGTTDSGSGGDVLDDDGVGDFDIGPDDTGEPPASGLGLDGEDLTWNGRPTFFLGVSYFDARNWHESDLDGLQRRGWRLIRIWLDWGDAGLFGDDGALTTEGAQILVDLVDAAGDREMAVDVTILDPDPAFAADTDHRVAAVQSVAGTLLERNNVLYDVMNEHDHGDGPIDHAEAAVIVAALREVDPDAIVTISSTGGHLVADDATVQTVNVDEEIDQVGVALVTPHLPRTADWADQTDVRVSALRDHLESRGIVMPIYLQEEARRGHSGLDPTEAEFAQAAGEAFTTGAAAWIFHTDAGFDLAASTFFDALDPVEASVVDVLPSAL